MSLLCWKGWTCSNLTIGIYRHMCTHTVHTQAKRSQTTFKSHRGSNHSPTYPKPLPNYYFYILFFSLYKLLMYWQSHSFYHLIDRSCNVEYVNINTNSFISNIFIWAVNQKIILYSRPYLVTWHMVVKKENGALRDTCIYCRSFYCYYFIIIFLINLFMARQASLFKSYLSE